MNTLLTHLAGFCRAHPFDEKVLIVPSYSVGHQIIEVLVRNGSACVNLRPETVAGLARRLLEPYQEIPAELSEPQAIGLIEEACRTLLDERSYFFRLRESPGLHAALLRTITELRMAGVKAAEIPIEVFEVGSKGEELIRIQHYFEEKLTEQLLVDDPGLLQLAVESTDYLRSAVAQRTWYLYPETLALSGLEKQFLQKLGADRTIALKGDRFSESIEAEIQFFRASGEENEIREVLGRILQLGIPLDQVEILFTQSETYLPLLYEIAAEVQIPVTFAQGIPVSFTRPGQALIHYCEWLQTGFDALVLRRALLGGFFAFRNFGSPEEIPSPLKAARILTQAAVGWDRERYLPCFDQMISAYSTRIEACEVSEDQPEEDEGEDEEWLCRQRDYANTLRRFIARLLEITPETSGAGLVSWLDLVRAARTVLSELTVVSSEHDGKARVVLDQLLIEIETTRDVQLTLPVATERLDAYLRFARSGALGSQPGQVHAASIMHGGWSGRPHTFVLGIDESRHPGDGLPDPILLDGERRKMAEITRTEMEVSSTRLERRNAVFFSVLARARGLVTLSYSCRDLLEDREQFPSPALLEVFRRVSGNQSAGYETLSNSLGAPRGFSSESREPLEETEYWLREMANSQADSRFAPALLHAYSWLADGLTARCARESDHYTVFDGLIQTGGELDPRGVESPVSATRIEALAGCPFAYFLQYVLCVVPPDLRQRDPMIWLQPMEFGQLLHEILYRFMSRVIGAGEVPSFREHWALLEAEAAEQVSRFRRTFPPPNETAFDLQREEVLEACRIFLKNEEQYCQEASPLYFEIEFGLPETEPAERMSSPEPVVIELGNHESFRLRGRIDRIDRVGPRKFAVWDYKSGSTWSVKEETLFNCGRQLQHALYACAAEALLKRAGEDGQVVTSGYFFPSQKGEGLRIVKRRDPDGMRATINDLFDLLRDGVFVSSLDGEKCEYCDYNDVCGGKAVAVVASVEKFDADDNSELGPLRRLRNV